MAQRGFSMAMYRKSHTWPMVKKYANHLAMAGGMHLSRKISHSWLSSSCVLHYCLADFLFFTKAG